MPMTWWYSRSNYFPCEVLVSLPAPREEWEQGLQVYDIIVPLLCCHHLQEVLQQSFQGKLLKTVATPVAFWKNIGHIKTYLFPLRAEHYPRRWLHAHLGKRSIVLQFFWVKIMAFNGVNSPDALALCWRLLPYLLTLRRISRRGDEHFSRAEDPAAVFCLRDVMLPCPELAPHISEGSVFLGIALVKFTSIQQGFIYLFQQEIRPLAFITSIFSLNTVLSLYLHSVYHVFQCLPFCVHLLDWSRTVFHARVVCCARHRSANKNSGWQ